MTDYPAAMFRPMSEYDRHNVHEHVECYCGPSVVIRMRAPTAYPHFLQHIVAHLDDDDWYARRPQYPGDWDLLEIVPESWMPFPHQTLASDSLGWAPDQSQDVYAHESPKALFRPMSHHPRDRLSRADRYWGPPVLVRVPPSPVWPYDTTYFVAQQEGRDWFACADFKAGHFEELHGKPDAWMPIPDIFLVPLHRKERRA